MVYAVIIPHISNIFPSFVKSVSKLNPFNHNLIQTAAFALLFQIYFCVFNENNPLKTTAASTAPIIGATTNNHTWLSASPPAKTAGAKLRAGLTDVPVSGIPMR